MGCGSSTPARPPQNRRRTNRGGVQRENVHEKGYKKRIRENLRHATAGNDIQELEKCIATFERNNMEDGGDLADAKEKLDYLLLRKEIRDATLRKHPTVLDKAIQRVETSKYRQELKPWLDRAYFQRKHLAQLDEYRHDILNMEQTTISEIRSYHHPPDGVCESMRATYMVLGYPEEKLEEWPDITALMGRYGKESLMREVMNADTQDMDDRTAVRARYWLNKHSLDEIRKTSNGAATFHVWANKMIDHYEGNRGKGGGGADPNAQKTSRQDSRRPSQNTQRGQHDMKGSANKQTPKNQQAKRQKGRVNTQKAGTPQRGSGRAQKGAVKKG